MRNLKQKINVINQTIKTFGFNFATLKFLKNSRIGGGHHIVEFKNKKYAHPIYLRKNTTDIVLVENILMEQEYAAIVIDFEPKVIIDCGANIGFTAIYFKNRFPQAKIICIEPELDNYNLLVKNTERYDDIICYNTGIWSHSAYLTIDDAGMGNWGFTVKETEVPVPGSIKGLSIEDIMKENRLSTIDILKIDIEGSEKEVFESNFDYWLSKTKVLAVELHDWMKPGCSKSVFSALVNYDFSFSFRNETAVFHMK